jgi:subtilisin family serine protease
MDMFNRATLILLSGLLLFGVAPQAVQADNLVTHRMQKQAEYLRGVYRVTGNLRSLANDKSITLLQRGNSKRASVGSARITFSAPLDDSGFLEKRAELFKLGVKLERISIYRAQAITDPDYIDGEQWDLRPYARDTNPAGLNVEGAWAISTGTGAVVAVLDTGFLPGHPDFTGLDVLPGYDFVSYYDNDATSGRDSDPTDPGDGIDNDDPSHDSAQAACGGSSSSPSSWHGTHVAGTIVAQNDATGITGIAPDASLLPVRVLGQCGGDDLDIADAIRWSAGIEVAGVPINNHPADVINLSLGGWGPDCDTPMGDAITDALAAGTITVVAAGNESDDARNYSPASCTDAVTVAALGPGGAPTPYTNVGPGVDIAAPGGDRYYAPAVTPGADYPDGCPFGTTSLSDLGVPGWIGAPSIWCKPWKESDVDGQIISTVSSDPFNFEGNYGYAHYQGTSMAAPHVAGVVALIRAAYPSLSASIVVSAMTSRSGQYFERGGTNRDFQDLSWMTNWLLAWGYVDGFIDVGLSLTPSQVLAFDWSSYWTDYWPTMYYGDLPCTPTAISSMAYLVLDGDPCAKVTRNVLKSSWWELTSWSAYGKASNQDWYLVRSGGACSTLGCGTGAVNALKALTYAGEISSNMLITNTALPTLSGTVRARGNLSAKAGKWSSGYKLSYQYQWYSCSLRVLTGSVSLDGSCVPIAGATKSSFRLSPAVTGTYLLVGVTASNDYSSLVRYSASTSVSAP